MDLAPHWAMEAALTLQWRYPHRAANGKVYCCSCMDVTLFCIANMILSTVLFCLFCRNGKYRVCCPWTCWTGGRTVCRMLNSPSTAVSLSTLSPNQCDIIEVGEYPLLHSWNACLDHGWSHSDLWRNTQDKRRWKEELWLQTWFGVSEGLNFNWLPFSHTRSK